MSPTILATVPIHRCGEHPGGTIVLSSPEPHVYLAVLTSPPDNRLTSPVCDALLQVLDIVEFTHPPGVFITTSGIPKFFSNGLDLEHATSTPGYWTDKLYTLWARLLSYPMPTLALLNGHAFAGGLMTAMHHDYRIANPTRGFLCLNELDFGAPLKPPMASIFRIKLPPTTYRTLVLEARRFTGPDALATSIVDGVGGLDDALRFIRDRGLVTKGKTGVYGLIKREMYRESMDLLSREGWEREERKEKVAVEADEERRERGKKAVEAWTKSRL